MYQYSATVNRVIDGDTIEVTVDLGFSLSWVTPVRLFGINAPEMNSKVEAERDRAKAARDCRYIYPGSTPCLLVREFS